MAAIEGTKEVVIMMRFAVPAGMQPEHVTAMISSSGISLALGLREYLKETTAVVQDVVPGVDGPKLVQ
jgi:hypothetical protein